MNESQMSLEEAPRPVARADDPSTSWAAARSVGRLRESQEAVLTVLRLFRNGATDESLAAAYGARERSESYPHLSPSGLRTRRSELVTLRLVRDSGRRERMRSGRMAVVWQVTP